MQGSAESELQENDANFRNRQENCNLRFTEVQTVIDSATARKADDERAYPIKQDELSIKTQQLKDKSGQEKRNLDRIALLERQREEEKVSARPMPSKPSQTSRENQ